MPQAAAHATSSRPAAPASSEDRVLLPAVPWATYVVLRDSIESASIRMTYLEGRLEIMSPSPKHEFTKSAIGRVLELFAVLRDIPLTPYGSSTMRNEASRRGLEPDECYSRGRDTLPPDFAIEVVVSNAAIDKLEVYRGLGVREVWVYTAGAFKVLALEGETYQPIPASRIVPEIDLKLIARFVEREDHSAAMRELRDLLLA